MQRRRYERGMVSGVLVALAVVATPVFAQGTTGDTANLRPTAASGTPANVTAEKIKKSRRVAYMMAKYEWLDKVAESNPQVLAAICERSGPARVLARHRHLDKMANSDHYLCRRLTRWKRATDVLVRNPHASHVISLDPEGIYFAIDRDPHIATLLASHVRFEDMVSNNPDLARVIDQHVH